MSEFYSEKIVKVRKPRRCEGCGQILEKGETALAYSGKFDGEFGSFTLHPECRQAEIALNDAAGTRQGEWYALGDIEPDDWQWLHDEYPVVAARFNVTAEKIAAMLSQRAARWGTRNQEPALHRKGSNDDE